MAKTRRELSESLRLVDMAIEALDARVPNSSQNPEIARILAGKPKVVALNKSDLADPRANESWLRRLGADGVACALVNAKTSKGVAPLRERIARMHADKMKKMAGRGVVSRPVRVMVVGIPNSGKSTIINTLARRASAMTGDKPGVTRSRQWIKLEDGVELLDTPGVLWPKFDDEDVGFRLAATGAIKDDIVDTQAVAERLLRVLAQRYPRLLEGRYGIAPGGPPDGERDGRQDRQPEQDRQPDLMPDGERDNQQDRQPVGQDGIETYAMLRAVCSARGFLLRGGSLDLSRAASTALDEFRAARIGRISLEWPQ